MKQQIKIYVDYILGNKKIMSGVLVAFVGLLVYTAQNIYMDPTRQGASLATSGEVAQDDVAPMSDVETNIATVGSDIPSDAISPGNSWPGEVISSAISQIQPQREGVIIDWQVRIGDTVSVGQVLGRISAAPAMPELLTMLAEKAEMASRSKAEAIIADEFAAKEQERYDALKNTISGNAVSGADLSFTALDSMRKESDAMRNSTRSFIERALSGHILTITNASSWRYFKYGSLNRQYGVYNQIVQNDYESALIRLVDKLKIPDELPIEEAEKYFALAVSLANNSGNEEMEKEFKMTVADDQMNFLKMLSDYRMTQSKVATMETEYKIMAREGSAMVEKDRLMARAEAEAAEAAYNTVSREITGGSYIISPRAGVVSAIYKKAGDLVNPMMSIAVVSGYGEDNLTVRMRIPNNVRKPARGEVLSVARPGFSRDIYRVKVIGVGTSLDDTGSYMADASLIDRTNWSAGISVRVMAPENSDASVVKLLSVWWDQDGAPHVWGVTEIGRIFAKKIIIGRTLGAYLEVYEGMKNGDRYVIAPTPDMEEDMLLTNEAKTDEKTEHPTKSGGHENMSGM